MSKRILAKSTPRGVSVLIALAVGSVALVFGAGVTSTGTARLALAVSGGFLLAALAARKPRAAIYVLVVWLTALGTVRRMTTGISGAFSFGDPLLLVAPAVFLITAITAVQEGATQRRSRLTNAVIVLAAVLTLSALNPKQGTLAIGLAGATLVVVPILAFFIGRTILDDRTLRRLLVLLIIVGIPAAAYGLLQVFVSFPTWDQRWIEQQGYNALRIGQAIRPFGSFASGQEFGLAMGVGLVVLLSFSQRLRGVWLLPALLLFGCAIWYESGRSIIVSVLVAVFLVLALKARWPLPRGLLVAGIAVALLPWLVGQFTPPEAKQSATGDLVHHQFEGLTDPLGDNSTLPGHIDLVTAGLVEAVSSPLGSGVGSVTVAAGRLGGDRAGTEIDVSNAAIGGGVLALLAYLAVVVFGFGGAYRLALQRRDALSYAVVGVLAVTFFQWLNGGLYAVAWLPWLLLGWVDGQARTPNVGEPAMASVALDV